MRLNRTVCFPGEETVCVFMSMLERTVKWSSVVISTSKVAFRAGSSQHGNARRAEVGSVVSHIFGMLDVYPFELLLAISFPRFGHRYVKNDKIPPFYR